MKITYQNVIFLLFVCGAFGDEVKKVMEGESVTLKSDLTDIQNYWLISWRFDSDLIAEISDGKVSYEDGPDGRFRDRLQLDSKTASLTITNMKMKDSGVYKLEAASSSSGTKYKTLNVSVYVPDQKTSDEQTPDSVQSPAAVAGIVVGVLLVVFAAAGGGIYYRKNISEPKSRKDGAEPKESNDPLTSGSANGEGS